MERFSFESSYLKNLAMSGSVSYSESKNTVNGFNEAIAGWVSRTIAAGSKIFQSFLPPAGTSATFTALDNEAGASAGEDPEGGEGG